jgi:ubiquinone/menaquinone biosynthesis C-methylase UbiE
MTPNRSGLEHAVASHYGKGGLAQRIFNGLELAGVNPEAPTVEELSPVDEFHTAGRITTLKAIELMPLSREMHVLDAGCGIGGTARCVAHQIGCRVTGIDLTPEFVEVARTLTVCLGLSELCAFELGSVLDMPFDNASFDASLTFHVAMNIEDRGGFYAELARVLRTGAPLCVFDVMKGAADGMVFPVPWAETSATSFLKSRDETTGLLEASGFRIVAETNFHEFALQFFRDAVARASEGNAPPPLGLHLLTGPNSSEKFSNYLKGLEAHQIEPIMLLAERRGRRVA